MLKRNLVLIAVSLSLAVFLVVGSPTNSKTVGPAQPLGSSPEQGRQASPILLKSDRSKHPKCAASPSTRNQQ